MMTRGTNTSTCTDAELREAIALAAEDVATAARKEGATDYEIQFSMSTLNTVNKELRVRASVASDEDVSVLA